MGLRDVLSSNSRSGARHADQDPDSPVEFDGTNSATTNPVAASNPLRLQHPIPSRTRGYSFRTRLNPRAVGEGGRLRAQSIASAASAASGVSAASSASLLLGPSNERYRDRAPSIGAGSAAGGDDPQAIELHHVDQAYNSDARDAWEDSADARSSITEEMTQVSTSSFTGDEAHSKKGRRSRLRWPNGLKKAKVLRVGRITPLRRIRNLLLGISEQLPSRRT